MRKPLANYGKIADGIYVGEFSGKLPVRKEASTNLEKSKTDEVFSEAELLARKISELKEEQMQKALAKFLNRIDTKEELHEWIEELPSDSKILCIAQFPPREIGAKYHFINLGVQTLAESAWLADSYRDYKMNRNERVLFKWKHFALFVASLWAGKLSAIIAIIISADLLLAQKKWEIV